LLYLQPGSGDTYTASCTPEEWQGFWHRYFDLNRNYAAIRAAVPKQDAYLCAAARAGAGIRILRQDAWEMLEEIQGRALLGEVRGRPPRDREALVSILLKVSRLAVELEDRLEELDINPVIVYEEGAGAVAADALLVLR
ncbi:MAG TPA: acetate--CoA ligase family protein, partial [Bacillota bacterium]|nr:acetate--CoA ligase family protein [Bacillota bacterium]